MGHPRFVLAFDFSGQMFRLRSSAVRSTFAQHDTSRVRQACEFPISVRCHVQCDDGEDSSSCHCRASDQQSHGVSSQDGDGFERCGAEGLIAAPLAEQCCDADDERGEGQSDE